MQSTASREELLKQIVKKDFFLEFQFHNKHGVRRFGMFSGRQIELNGEHCLLLIARDITERKQTEMELLEANNRFHALAKVTNIIPWEIDQKQQLIYVSSAIKKWGLNSDLAINKKLTEFISFKNDMTLKSAIDKIIHQGQESYVECFSAAIDKLKIDLEVRARPLHDAFGEVIGAAGTLQDVSRFINTERELRDLAAKDPVTNLYNRRGFYMELESHIRSRRREDKELLLLYIDLDDFKNINDTHGHDVGDELLLNVADAMLETLRTTDVVARIGGDEFVALLTNTPVVYAEVVCQRILNAFGEIMLPNIKKNGVFASLGLVPVKDLSAEEAMIRADAAMYKAKHRGKNQYCIE